MTKSKNLFINKDLFPPSAGLKMTEKIFFEREKRVEKWCVLDAPSTWLSITRTITIL